MPGGKVEGKIVAVTDAGNLVTDITADALRNAPRDEQTSICCDEHETRGLFTSDHHEPNFTFLAILNDAGQMELCIVGDSARDMLGLRIGYPVVVKW